MGGLWGGLSGGGGGVAVSGELIGEAGLRVNEGLSGIFIS